jgi:hypothetical protein
MEAAVAEEDPAAVCRVGVASQVLSRGRGDFHTGQWIDVLLLANAGSG